MVYEVMVGGIDPKVSKFEYNRDDCSWGAICDNYDLDVFQLYRPVSIQTQFLAIGDKESHYIRRIFRINHSKSDFDNGIIVPDGRAVMVLVDLELNVDKIGSHVWYTTFKNLLLHPCVEEFVEEKASIIPRVRSMKFLCNGSECNHICYCKFFNHSDEPVTKVSQVTNI
jgi:hypothetical protein